MWTQVILTHVSTPLVPFPDHLTGLGTGLSHRFHSQTISLVWEPDYLTGSIPRPSHWSGNRTISLVPFPDHLTGLGTGLFMYIHVCFPCFTASSVGERFFGYLCLFGNTFCMVRDSCGHPLESPPHSQSWSPCLSFQACYVLLQKRFIFNRTGS